MRARLSGDHPELPLMVYVGRLSFEKRLDWLYAPHHAAGGRTAGVCRGPGPAEKSTTRNSSADTPTVFFTGYMSGDEFGSGLRFSRCIRLSVRHRNARVCRDGGDGVGGPGRRGAGWRHPGCD